MTILKATSSKETTKGKPVVVDLPEQVNYYFSLYTLAQGITKTMIVREEMKKWYKNKLATCSEDSLVQTVKQRVVSEWKARKSNLPSSNLLLFKQELFEELIKKGIKYDYASEIIQSL